MAEAAIAGGFSAPVFDAQKIFRALMDALARPGTVHEVGDPAAPPAPLSPTAGAVALTLLDADTPVWLDEQLSAAKPVRDWIAFQCGAPVTSILAEAHFALVSQPSAMPSMENFSQGSQSYPDRSATLVLQVDGFDGGNTLFLEGPGIEAQARFSPTPLPRHFSGQWRQNNGRFPCGVDLVFAAPGAVAAMPRTARIVEGGA